MKAFILAAGRGSRLHPYTAHCPKCLTTLGGMPLIERQLATLRHAGIDDITIVTGYCAEMLELPGTKQRRNERWESTNMVESLFAAETDFDDDIVVAYSDILYEPRVVDALISSDEDISVVIDRQWRSLWEFRFDDPLSDAESLRLDADGNIIDIGNKVDDIGQIEAQYIGLMRFRGDGVATLKSAWHNLGQHPRDWMSKRSRENAYMTDLLMEIVLTGHALSSVVIDGGWIEIDTVEDFEKFDAAYKDGSISHFYTPYPPVSGKLVSS